MSQRALGSETGASGSLIGHYERAERTPSKRFVAKADEVLGASGHLLGLWPDVVRTIYPEYASTFFEALGMASLMREYHPTLVPGLLQTEDYARTALTAGNPMESEDYVEPLVRSRMDVQSTMVDTTAPIHWSIITEYVLRRLSAEPALLLGQVDRLLSLMNTRVRLQVVPDNVLFRDHPGTDGPFTVFSFADRQDIAYVEGVTAGAMITRPEQVERLSLKFGSLQSVALSPAQTESFLTQLRGEADGHPRMAQEQLQQQRRWGLPGSGGDSSDGPGPRHPEP